MKLNRTRRIAGHLQKWIYALLWFTHFFSRANLDLATYSQRCTLHSRARLVDWRFGATDSVSYIPMCARRGDTDHM